jgi:hypothetical protein
LRKYSHPSNSWVKKPHVTQSYSVAWCLAFQWKLSHAVVSIAPYFPCMATNGMLSNVQFQRFAPVSHKYWLIKNHERSKCPCLPSFCIFTSLKTSWSPPRHLSG